MCKRKGGFLMDKKQAHKKAMEVVQAYCNKKEIPVDPQGSWTGKPHNSDELPVQDADDL